MSVRANQSVIVQMHGKPRVVRKFDEFESDDPVVREYPWLFADSGVERATAAPGERRNVRRPAK